MRKVLATGLLLGLVWAGSPSDAEAASSLSIRGADPATKTITIEFTEGRVGDWYHIYSNDKVLFNTLNTADVQVGQKTIDVSALGDLRNGAEVRAELRSNSFPQYLHARHLVGGQVSTPEVMTLNTRSTLLADGTNQHLGLQVTGPYSPDAKDILRVSAYNATGSLEGNVKYFALPAEVVADPDTLFSLPLTPTQEVVRYDIEILRNSQVLASVQYLFNGAGKPDAGQDEPLILEYPATAQAGEQLSGKVFMKDANGDQIDITGLAAFHFEGPVELGSLSNGSFKVAADAVPGQVLRVKATIGSYEAQHDIRIEGASAPPVNPTPGQARGDVVMTIDSKTFYVNGQARETEVAPFIQNSRTFVPVRALAESLGATVEFDPNTYQITISQGNHVVIMHANSRSYSANGVGKTMDVAPYIAYSGRTIVPVRFAAEALGYKIQVTQLPNGQTKDLIFSNA